MRAADQVVVNSRFTKGVVEGIWKWLCVGSGAGIIYPCVDTSGVREKIDHAGIDERKEIWKGKKVVLSINRFEKKKNIGLVIRAYAGLTKKDRGGAKLLIAGWSSGVRSIEGLFPNL